MTNVLHITPHFGGGVGSVLRTLIDGLQDSYGYQQEIVTFEDMNAHSQEWARAQGHTVHSEMSSLSPALHAMARASDIVHIHFWNHPLTYQFLWAFSGGAARVVLWAHCNGHHAPNMFPSAALTFPEIFVTTSEYSLKAPSVQAQSEEWRKNHICNITSCCDTTEFTKITPVKHSGIVVGYVGTVDYCKMHRDSINILAAVSTPDIRFIICGEDSHNTIQTTAQTKGVASKFDFLGKVSNVPSVLAEMDIFAYPLTPDHYGTGEQVLVEAMAAGIPQVVLNNGPESSIVQNGITGIIANSPEAFTNAIELLASDPELRLQMGINSKRHAAMQHTTTTMVNAWNMVYTELLSHPKKTCIFNCPPLAQARQNDVATGLFLCSLVDEQVQNIFSTTFSFSPNPLPEEMCDKLNTLHDIYFAEGKGSIHQYARFLKDVKLLYASRIVREIKQ